MPKLWRWAERKRAIIAFAALCWLGYLAAVLAIMYWAFPPVLAQTPSLFLVVLVVFVGPPAWIHFNWVTAPGYLFMSNGIRRFRFSERLAAQVSRRKNADNIFGVPMLPADMRTTVCVPSASVNMSSDQRTKLVGGTWDPYLYAAAALHPDSGVLPKRTTAGAIWLDSDRLTFTAGRWRPGAVLSIPFSRVVGVWNGADIPTISSGNVIVVVVEAGGDELLFPFEVARRDSDSNRRVTVEAMVAAFRGIAQSK
jgi:hypothetical protein